MPKDITTTVYTFEELNDKAKDKARAWWIDACVNDEWHDSVFDDAKQIGLKIIEFDEYRQTIDGEFIDGAFNCANELIKYHGEGTKTCKAARKFIVAFDAAPDTDSDESRAGDLDAAESDFLQEILQDYLKTLCQELEYQQSDECVDGNIKANEYTFTADGERFG